MKNPLFVSKFSFLLILALGIQAMLQLLSNNVFDFSHYTVVGWLLQMLYITFAVSSSWYLSNQDWSI